MKKSKKELEAAINVERDRVAWLESKLWDSIILGAAFIERITELTGETTDDIIAKARGLAVEDPNWSGEDA
jgi:hypothetical protein